MVARYAAKECDVMQDVQKSGWSKIEKSKIEKSKKRWIVVRGLIKEKATRVAIKIKKSYIVYIIIEYIKKWYEMYI